MAYDKFQILKSTAVPLQIENVDTDQIIPARFLKATERKGFGDNLFRDWRYNSDDSVKKDFVLNNTNFKGKILVGGKNFGSGSSREHAAWAIYDYGFRVVLSSFFADIFKSNALNNGLLVIQFDQKTIDEVFKKISDDIHSSFSVDLEEQRFFSEDGFFDERFEINEYNKTCLINGFDNIDYLLNIKDKILKFEESKP